MAGKGETQVKNWDDKGFLDQLAELFIIGMHMTDS